VKDLTLDKNHKRGSKGGKVKLIQEWLCLHGFHLAIDGDFGPATDRAVREFQTKKKLGVTGVVNKSAFEALVRQMTDALLPIPAGNKSLGQMLVAYAKQHLKQHPREIGGQNMGPWVRLYVQGNQGRDWPWCAGFTCFLLREGCKSLGRPLPFGTSVSCDTLAANGKVKGVFLKEPSPANRSQITPGSFFLNRRTRTDWTHTGIVLDADNEVLRTIEGNTNDEGSREGYEVCQRTRGYKEKDFLLVSNG
jgi:hypothetical protein